MEQVGKCDISKRDKLTEKRRKDVISFMRCCITPIAHIGQGDFINFPQTNIVDAVDFNFAPLKTKEKYRTVLCFEILEHLQNPLHFLREIRSIMRRDGVLFLSTPNKPKFLWSEYHYNEISGTHMQKWLLDPLDMEIVRKKRLYMNLWTDYLIGFRPLWRAIKTMNFKPIILNITNTTWIYEIRLKK